MTRFVVEDSFWKLFPQATIGIIVARGMKPASEISEESTDAIKAALEEANALAQSHLTSETISENKVVAEWREAYKKFKTKKGVRCSIENLLKRVLKGNPVGSITPAVDIYNAISLKYAVPVGGENIDAFSGDLRLGVTEGGDPFMPLGEDKDDPTLPGEICYRDDEGAVCRCLNWRDAQRTALNDETENGFLVIECVDPDHAEMASQALEELAGMIETHMGATIAKKEILTSSHPTAELG